MIVFEYIKYAVCSLNFILLEKPNYGLIVPGPGPAHGCSPKLQSEGKIKNTEHSFMVAYAE